MQTKTYYQVSEICSAKNLVLNGDIIDSWRFSRKYFPRNHLKVEGQFLKKWKHARMIPKIDVVNDDKKEKKTKIGKNISWMK